MSQHRDYKERLSHAQAHLGQPGQHALVQLLEAHIDMLKERSIDEPMDRKGESHAAIKEIRAVLSALRNDRQVQHRVAQRY